MTAMPPIHESQEAAALAACYRLLLQKARERRSRLAKTAVTQNQTTDDQCIEHGQYKESSGKS